MSNHTPGPWEVHDGGSDTPTICKVNPDANGGRGGCNILAFWGGSSIHEHEREQTMNLIAAAPDLLEACEKALDKFKEAHDRGDLSTFEEMEACRKAIAKTKGETA